MRTIWKFKLAMSEWQRIDDIPMNAKIIHVGFQQVPSGGQSLYFWAEVETNDAPASRSFAIVGTGQKVLGGKHVGTVQEESYVWHIYDLGGVGQ